ncbi:MAG TPA: hypothetical protein PK644_09725, partial [bacterium]|nr:hypothetical protein [bacterium]
RYGADGLPGVADQDDDRDQMLLSSDGIDNDGDGLVDEEGEGIDEPDEFSIRWPRGGDRPYIIPQDLRLVPGCSEKLFWQVQPFLSTFSVDFNENRQKVTRLNLNQASFDDFFELFKRLGYEKFHAAQLAANSIDFRDKDSLPTVVELDGHKIIGVEKVPAFNEVEAVVPFEIKEIPIGLEVAEKAGQFIEIFNPYPEDLDIGGWKITGVVTVPLSVLNVLLKESRTVYDDVTRGETQVDAGRIRDLLEAINPTSILIPPGTVLKAHSYYTIGDLVRLVIIIPVEGTPFPLVLPLRDPDGCQQYEPILVLNPAGSEKFSIFLRKLPFLEKLGFDFTLRLYDNHDQLIEEARYPVDTPWTTVQKNDPRMRGTLDWFPFEGSPGQQNSVFQPWVSGEFGKVGWVHLWPSSFCVKNRSFSTIAELSFVHRQQQWRTLDFWRTGEDRAILDEVTVVARPALATLGR